MREGCMPKRKQEGESGAEYVQMTIVEAQNLLGLLQQEYMTALQEGAGSGRGWAEYLRPQILSLASAISLALHTAPMPNGWWNARRADDVAGGQG